MILITKFIKKNIILFRILIYNLSMNNKKAGKPRQDKKTTNTNTTEKVESSK